MPEPLPVVVMVDEQPELEPEPQPKAPLSASAIVAACCWHFGISLADMKCAGRTADIVRPRQVAMYLTKTLTQLTLPAVGRRFGGRDHTTVLHAVRKIERLIREDWTLAHDVAVIEAEMGIEP
jgi:chromosomal replication initiator protein